MEIDDLRGMTDDELNTDVYETHRELMNLRFRAATMQLADMNTISKAKKRIARINTLLRERELANEIA